uniref:Uncharacterized AAA domain-containing protein ycf46 n=1 Tax=Dichotomaria marginata TaxID=268567 RepID=A0A1G4NS36_9FLOR|nr:Hypothetical protein ycf46 [Dichotomaria marginata]SCW21480.1 Hypothetical protein ycf46 [Dichotomaria marginata]
MYFKQELELLVKSSCSLIYIVTSEEERLQDIIKSIVKNDISQAVYQWDFIEGYYSIKKANTIASKNPLKALEFIEDFSQDIDAIFLLKDFSCFFNDVSIIRKIRNLSSKLDLCNQVILFSGLEISIPVQLKQFITVIELPLPDKLEIECEIIRLIKLFNIEYNNLLIDNLVNICQGLSISQIRKIISKIIVQNGCLDIRCINLLLQEKGNQIKQTSLLELHYSSTSLADIGGIDNLKDWLYKRSNAFSQASFNYGLSYPKGLLLVGIQGTGKSMSAKAIAHAWNLVLLRLDIGKLFGGIVGESELNTRNMIQVVEASSPCILWIDEIDKAFSLMSIQGDSGTSNRVLATLLTWLSEKTSPVFVVATANNISNLPNEILRKGRFDEIFFINLPNFKERKKIFQVHLQKIRPDTWHRYNIPYLAKYSHLFSGAEIKQVIIEAMHTAFHEQREFTSLDILNAIDTLVPLAFTDQNNVEKLQTWASLGKIRLA